MVWHSGTYVTIIFLAALATLTMGAYAWRYRSAAPGALWFALLMVAVAWWVGMTGLDMLAQTQQLSMLFSELLWIGSLSVAPLGLRFAAAYSGNDRRLSPWMRWAIWIVPAAGMILVWSNALHGWVWEDVVPAPPDAAVTFIYEHGPAVIVVIVYSYALIGISAWLLVQRALEARGGARRSLLALVLAFLLPLVANAFYFADVVPAGAPDITALAFALSAVLCGFIVFSGRLLDVAPVAYGALVRTMDDGIVVVDGDGRVRGVNDAAERLLGLGPDVVGRQAAAVLRRHPDVLRALTAPISRSEIRAEGNPHERWLEVSVSDVVRSRGRPTGRLALLHDVTDYRRTQDELRENEAQYHQLFDTSSEAIFIQTEGGAFVDVNKGASDLLGYPHDYFPGKSPRDLSAPGRNDLEAVDGYIKAAARGEEPLFEFWALHEDGEAVPLEVRLDAGTFFGRDVVIAHAVDITARKRSETQLLASSDRLRRSLESTVAAMGQILEHRDPYTAGHERRVTELATAMAAELRLDRPAAETLRLASDVHDIGKIAIPADILSRPGPLSTAEFELVTHHPEVGFSILRSIEFDGPVSQIVRDHHERLDGSGYPRGLSGEQIESGARILAVADVVEAMCSHRPYRHARGLEAALAEIETGRGRLYDPEAVDACLRVFRDRGFRFAA